MSTTLSLTNLTDHLNRDRTIARDSVRWKKTRGPLTRILVPVLNADTSNSRLTAPVVTDERVVRSNVSSTVFLRIAGDLVVLALMVLLSVTGGMVFWVAEAGAASPVKVVQHIEFSRETKKYRLKRDREEPEMTLYVTSQGIFPGNTYFSRKHPRTSHLYRAGRSGHLWQRSH